MDILLIKSPSAKSLDRLLNRVTGTVQRFGTMALVQNPSPHEDGNMQVRYGRALAYAGYVQDTNVLGRLDYREGRLYMKSPGGIASFFVVDSQREQCYAWSSHAGVQGVYYSSGPDGTVISNRSSLSHRVAFGSVTMSRAWARRALLDTGSLWYDTPFKGTRFIEPRSCVAVTRQGRIVHWPHPVLLQGKRYRDRSQEGVNDYIEATMEALRVTKKMPPAMFYLSGGKDSRYLAAVAHRMKLAVDPVCFDSIAQQGEAPEARAVARLVGWTLRVLPRSAVPEDRMLGQIRENIRQCDGQLSEVLHLIYPDSLPAPGTPLITGHAHHLRGGFTRTMKSSGVIEGLVAGATGPLGLVTEDIEEERRARAEELIDGMTYLHPADIGYWFYNDWRMHRSMPGPTLALARNGPALWPMLDERVLQVCSRLNHFDRVTEWTMFMATKQLLPGIEKIPLYNAPWRGDSGGKANSMFPEGFEERTRQRKRSSGWPGNGPAVAQRLWKRVYDAVPEAREVAGWLRPKILQMTLSEWGSSNAIAVRLCWRLIGISLVLEGKWMKTP